MHEFLGVCVRIQISCFPCHVWVRCWSRVWFRCHYPVRFWAGSQAIVLAREHHLLSVVLEPRLKCLLRYEWISFWSATVWADGWTVVLREICYGCYWQSRLCGWSGCSLAHWGRPSSRVRTNSSAKSKVRREREWFMQQIGGQCRIRAWGQKKPKKRKKTYRSKPNLVSGGAR